jgi:hypothetical protein
MRETPPSCRPATDRYFYGSLEGTAGSGLRQAAFFSCLTLARIGLYSGKVVGEYLEKLVDLRRSLLWFRPEKPGGGLAGNIPTIPKHPEPAGRPGVISHLYGWTVRQQLFWVRRDQR